MNRSILDKMYVIIPANKKKSIYVSAILVD